MKNELNINSIFSGKRIVVAIIICFAVTTFLLVRSLNQTKFIEVAEHGTHTWVDINTNGKVDVNANEIIPSLNGEYRESKLSDILLQLNFSFNTVLWLIVAIFCVALRDLAYMYRIRVLTHKQLTVKRSFYTIMLWEFASALSPGVVGGSAIAMFILRGEGVTMGKSTAIVIITTLMDNLFFVILIPFVLLFLNTEMLFAGNADWLINLFWLGYFIVLAISLVLFASIFIYPKLVGKILYFFTSFNWLKKWRNSAVKVSEEIVITSKVLRKESLLFWLKSSLGTLFAWISRYLVINCILMAFLNLSFLENIVVLGKQLILWLLMLVSPTPGASGVAEFAFSELLIDFSDSLLLLAALAIIWRLISYFPYLFIGAIILPKWLRTAKKK